MADPDMETRLRLAHQARRARKHQLDDIRRAMCDAGFMQDDDPYGHADLAGVIRQVGHAEAEETAVPPRPVRDCGKSYVHDAHGWDDTDGADYGCIGIPLATPVCPGLPGHETHSPPCGFFQRPEAAALTWPALQPCSINHDCPSQPRPEPLTARNEARCQSQHRAEGEPLVQCALAVHPKGLAHTDYDSQRMTITPPHGRPADLPWPVWSSKPEEIDRG
jgi:hypothetical protein